MDLAVKPREVVGKKVKALRQEGLIPAEVYGHGAKNAHITVTAKDFNKVFKEAGSTTVVTLVMDTEKRPAIIHEIARDSVSSEIIHIDFYQVKMDEQIKAKVPLEFIGVAPAIKEKGAVLNKSMSEIEVEAFPQDLPRSLIVDLSVLDDLDKSVYVKDIKRPKGVKFLVDEETAVATATEPLPEEVVEVKAEEVVDVTAVKSETEEKVAARQEAKAKEAPEEK